MHEKLQVPAHITIRQFELIFCTPFKNPRPARWHAIFNFYHNITTFKRCLICDLLMQSATVVTPLSAHAWRPPGMWKVKLHFQCLKQLFWLRITDEGSLPEMRIWSILSIKSDFKWCIHLSRSLFPYFNYLVSVTAGGPEGTCNQVLRSTSVDS